MLEEPLCGHGRESLRKEGYRLRCLRCGSFLDRRFASRSFRYDAAYPARRGHHDAAIGALKCRTLEAWLGHLGLDVAGRSVCEVGFGGAHCLERLSRRGARVAGLEAVEENLARARERGVTDVFAFQALPERLPAAVDLWLFQDSFEHLPDPEGFLAWLTAASAADARVLLVAPEAGSRSERWLGRLWPHRVPDHAFHWSRRGLVELFARHGFEPEASFHPAKHVSGAMLASHLAGKLPALALPPGLVRALSGLRLRFNLGELGMTFRRAA